MKINVEALVGTVLEQFDNVTDYYTKTWLKPNRANWQYFERNLYNGENAIRDLCNICNFDRTKLELIAKAIRKWEAKQNWERCFPIKEHSAAILKFIEKSDQVTIEEKLSWLRSAIKRHMEKRENVA